VSVKWKTLSLTPSLSLLFSPLTPAAQQTFPCAAARFVLRAQLGPPARYPPPQRPTGGPRTSSLSSRRSRLRLVPSSRRTHRWPRVRAPDSPPTYLEAPPSRADPKTPNPSQLRRPCRRSPLLIRAVAVFPPSRRPPGPACGGECWGIQENPSPSEH
jgi:hypothetical protein